jgi:hypothetical protein
MKPAKSSYLKSLAMRYEAWLASDTRAPATERAYRLELDRWQCWLVNQAIARREELTGDLVRRYLECLASDDPALLAGMGVRRPLLGSSLQQSRRILGAALLWLAGEGSISAGSALACKNWKPPMRTRDARIQQPLLPNVFEPDEHPVGYRQARREFVTGVACWTGASPKEIASLKFRDVRSTRHGLDICLPSPSGAAVWTCAPVSLKPSWRILRAKAKQTGHAVSRLRENRPLGPGGIARVMNQLVRAKGEGHSASRLSARRLRRAALDLLIRRGWSDADLRQHFRRTRVNGTQTHARKETILGQTINDIIANVTSMDSR